jgi:hypothetical protein
VPQVVKAIAGQNGTPAKRAKQFRHGLCDFAAPKQAAAINKDRRPQGHL